MKKIGIVCIFLFFFILSCSDKKYHIEMAKKTCKELSLLACIDTFWGYNFMKRGNMYVFNDIDCLIVMHFLNNQLVVDTIYPIVQADTSFISLDSLKLRNITNIVKCFSSLNIESMNVRGFNQDKMRVMEFSINDFLLLYYVPDFNDIGLKQKEILKNKAILLTEKWYCFVKREKDFSFIW